MTNNMIIAITGQSGTGKSSVGEFYIEKGYTVIDSDKIAVGVYNDCKCVKLLVEHFGEDILTQDQKINKSILSQKAFKTTESLAAITKITHPFIIDEILKKANAAFLDGEKIVFVDGAVIIGHSFEQYCDEIILVIASIENQIKRITNRDKISSEKAFARISKQMSNNDMIKKSKYIIYNNTDDNALEFQASSILGKIIQIQ